MADFLGKAAGQYRALYALRAECGPLRGGEALGFDIDMHISPDFRTLHIQQKAKASEIQPYLKTTGGERELDRCCSLARMLHANGRATFLNLDRRGSCSRTLSATACIPFLKGSNT